MNATRSDRFFWVGCLIELSLVPCAAALGRWTGQPLWSDLAWDARAAGVGALATIPPLAGAVWMMKSGAEFLAPMRNILDSAIRPLLGGWAVWQLAVISVLAGFSEEVLFRSVLQGGIARAYGTEAGLIVASAAFALLHALNWQYMIFTFLMGLYLGGLWIVTGNLLAPMIAHGLYDFLALIYLLRVVPWKEE